MEMMNTTSVPMADPETIAVKRTNTASYTWRDSPIALRGGKVVMNLDLFQQIFKRGPRRAVYSSHGVIVTIKSLQWTVVCHQTGIHPRLLKAVITFKFETLWHESFHERPTHLLASMRGCTYVWGLAREKSRLTLP